MIGLITLAMIASVMSGGLCGAIGFYIQRLEITTMSFSIAHAALAGASIGLVMGLDPTYSAMVMAIALSLLLGLIFTRISYGKELVSMAIFSACSAIALFSIYLSNVKVLATSSVAVILWGSILAITPQKLVILALATFGFSLYIISYKTQIDSMIYDRKIAEAEGIDVQLHTLAVLFFAGIVIALTLKLTGGFLVFALLYNPVSTSMQLVRKAHLQLVLSSVLGGASALSGIFVSYAFDWPVGATIAIISTVMLIISYIVGFLREINKKRCLGKLVSETGDYPA
ncbi:MAG: metal ABC transporter permease [Candidatus Korarchaeota archaeon]|nr:metal ABC transporter permease [Candidatus Korarchaeota archaeon]